MTNNKQHLRTGFTTGTCSAAVAKAAVYMLVNNLLLDHVAVNLPDGSEHILEIQNATIKENAASCHTIKDAGDDPDITNGIKIYASAAFTKNNRITLNAGKGIGIVTKPGLAVPVGKPAINPVPEKMIIQAIEEVLPNNTGVEVTISIPEGVEIAKKTFNPKLGIIDGISVLGTTGIVKPMSEEALKNSLELHLSQLAELGHKQVVLVPGNYAVNFLTTHFSIDPETVVQTSNFIGFMLECAVKYGFEKVLLVGHIGKLVKLSAGIFYTHSRIADARNEVITAHYLEYSKDSTTALKLMQTNTTEEAVGIIKDFGFWFYLSNKIAQRSEEYIHQDITVDTIIFSQSKGLLGYSEKASDFSSEFSSLHKLIQKEITQKTIITLCGIGPGNSNFITQQVFAEVAKADILIGGKRHLELFKDNSVEQIVFRGKLDDLQKSIQQIKNKRIVFLVSGDTGFYSLRNFIERTFPDITTNCIPGISSFQYMYAKLNMSYENAKLLSLHGKHTDFIKAVAEYDSVFLLTDKKNTYKTIAQTLIDNNMPNARMFVGNNLSYDDELLFSGSANEIVKKEYEADLCSVIIKRL